ncbi:MAG: hypothetical protein LHW57_05665 [Candidatus Cloacimonetes bacterium]|nr:hypothetical protein [Candidatus Cloacimonadota bacterium]
MGKTSLKQLLLTAGALILAAIALFTLLRVGAVWQILVPGLICCAALLYVYFRISADLRSMVDQAREINPQSRGRRFGKLRTAELDDLGRGLNRALDSLDGAIGHLAVHREELRLLLNTLEDVLWSQDDEGTVLWANEPFHKLFPVYDPRRQQRFWELIREPQLLAAIRNSGNAGKEEPADISIAGHSYLLSSSHGAGNQRHVFILHNIDSIQNTARMKREFIVNLAHELRTPLTAIKGFTESIRDTPGQEHSRQHKIILSHTNRIIHLIRDLEQLIRLESSSLLQAKEIGLLSFFANLRLILEPEIQEKGLSLDIELAPGLQRLVCDPFRFEQIFINLVQNSLRYTDTGGISIRCRREGDSTVFEVADTGRGIPAEHLDRIFERFYVADPSRNRSFSGTGLGLAIVKHIVRLHQGEITVSSEIGRGTTFKITIPPLAEMDDE